MNPLQNLAAFFGKTKPKFVVGGVGLMVLLYSLGAPETIVIFAGVLDGIALVGHILTDLFKPTKEKK